ncbi:Retrovirus-related Pol polyprotein from transposon 17.6, partial [Mucuna pruriens]
MFFCSDSRTFSQRKCLKDCHQLEELSTKQSFARIKRDPKYVTQLLDKGLVRETKSPCAILVILVPKKDGTWGNYTFDYILLFPNFVDDHVMHVKSVFLLLKKEFLYVNLEKCTYCINEFIFLGYTIGFEGVKVDEEKVRAIRSWLKSMSIGDVRSFHGLASFYRHFLKDFSTLATPLIEIVKKIDFQALKDRLTSAFILALPNFNKSFELEYDVFNMIVGTVLLQEGHPIAFFIEKQKKS